MNSRQQGFSLIELIMILAIAGILSALVFVAISDAQHNQRDDVRRNAAERYLNAAKQYVADHNGAVPTSATDASAPTNILSTYLTASGATFQNPQGVNWTAGYGYGVPGTSSLIFLSPQASCSAGISVANGGTNTRQIAVVVQLETSGQSYCLSS